MEVRILNLIITSNMLQLLIIFTIIPLFILFITNKFYKEISFIFSIVLFAFSLFIFLTLDSNSPEFQYYFYLLDYKFGLDNISIWFILLTTFLQPICILINWNNNQKEIFIYLYFIELLLIILFLTLNLLFFYILFESILIPMFFYIGQFGPRHRKIEAAFKFFIYTYIGSLFMFLGLVYINYTKGTLDIELLYVTEFTRNEQILLWLSFFASFSVKIPIVPFHIWLPEAHVEAPTAGSVLLAGILLKLGIYGFIRYSIPLFPIGSIYFLPLIYTIGLISILYSSLVTVRQIDLKKIIAYASIGHMNFVLLGLFSQSIEGLMGSMYIMLSHGFISSGLFTTIGFLYDRHHSRIIYYYRGLTNVMPLFAFFFFILNLANGSFPGTASFIGEFIILFPLLKLNPFIGILTTLSLLFSSLYSIWLINRIIFGSLTIYITKFNDLKLREISILILFTTIIIYFGLFPQLIFDNLMISLSYYFVLYL
jgi:proton-translocating NADH-quinone oxidoreductase chain M